MHLPNLPRQGTLLRMLDTTCFYPIVYRDESAVY